ncbi:MAG: SRPBCC family protein [Vicinamibacterales bacterium]
MRWVLYIGVGLVGLGLVVVLAGAMLPRAHTTSRVIHIDRAPEEVWEVITDFSNNPSWREDIKAVERMPNRDGREVWREVSTGGDVIPYETVLAEPPRRLVRRIADPSLPFSGSWTIDVSPRGTGSAVRITEQGEVPNPVFRFVSRVLIGHSSYIDKYLTSLARRFNQDAEPTDA